MGEWKECKLGDICKFQEGYVNPSQKIPEYFDGPIKWLRVNDLNNSFVYSTSRTLSEIGFKSAGVAAKLFKPNTLAISKSGTIGRLGILKDYMCGNRAVINIEPLGEIDYRFVFYILKSKSSSFADMAVGSVQPNLYVGTLSTLEFLLPPLPEQKAIAAVLSSLDDKIDLLHRQNKTLEAMAETLFRQWFVEEADEGWEKGNLGDIITVVSGTTPKTDKPEYWNGDYYWTSPRDITNLKGLFLFDTERKITQLGLEQIGSGLLPVGSLLMSSRAPIGALAFAEIPVAINQGYAGIICDKGYSREFVYFWLKTNMDFVQSHGNGSTFQEISKSTFRELDINIPDNQTHQKFYSLASPTFSKIRSNSIQIRSLEKLRDTLLPKLMSGELRVKV